MYKWCPRCKQHKLLTEFGTDRSRRDQKHSHCRLCRRGYRLLRKPVPTVTEPVATNFPGRGSVAGKKWTLFDQLCEAGVPVTILLPDGKTVDWSELV